MNAGRTARERARAELTREITDEARRQLARSGADGLSLRAVARELGMVSSALYRYFPSRDDLLTTLIVDAYRSLAAAAESADEPTAEPRRRLRAVCAAIRGWARAHPHEYALIYGSPIPAYRAPRETVESAARIPLALLHIVRAGWAARQGGAGAIATATASPGTEPERAAALTPGLPAGLTPGLPAGLTPGLPAGLTPGLPAGLTPGLPAGLPPGLREQLRSVAERFAPELPEPVLADTLMAWTLLFGVISFELFGQLVGSVDPSDEFFDHVVTRMADFVGLPPAPDD